MKYTTVKMSEIAKDPTMRLDAKYWIRKENMRENIKLIDRNNIIRKFYEIRKLMNAKDILKNAEIDKGTFYRIIKNKNYFPRINTIIKIETVFKNRMERIKQCLESF